MCIPHRKGTSISRKLSRIFPVLQTVPLHFPMVHSTVFKHCNTYNAKTKIQANVRKRPENQFKKSLQRWAAMHDAHCL